MSNHPSAPHTDRPTAAYPTGYPAYRPVSYPAGWQADPAGYAHPADPRLAQADATPTASFPTNRSARTRARYRTAQTDCQSVEARRPASEQTEQAPSRTEQDTPIQDTGRPGILSRPSMRWHPSLMQLAIGAALVLAIIGACNVAAIQAHREARAHCHALAVSDWARAERECRGTGEGTPVPEQVPSQPARPEQPSAPARQAPTSRPAWTVHGTDSPYDRTDPSASPLDLPRCTTSPGTPMPCLAHISNDSHHAVVLEEDASLTGLDRL